MWQCHSKVASGRRFADPAVRHFHEQLNQGQYRQIFQEADYGFIYDKTEGELAQFLQAIHTKLGDANSAEFIAVGVSATTGGSFITARYKTMFAHGTVVETFTWKENGHAFKLYRYDIRALQD